ncbi:hypothetical protein CYMTET_6228 [Cymbomonas tetramitiformis]|uniref:Ubiquitin-like protease family profile domain-containing protein n=1 Tax=Cymbomonas tetramitiformis TaxID=36881 RepID=A0AAE0GZG2_9CHLO|nr:hypothetical protein CYMTET_6228 [Cymbomonas tetramitiformis]
MQGPRRSARLAAQNQNASRAPRARPPPNPPPREAPAPNPPFRREANARERRQADVRQGEINDQSVYTTRHSGADIFDKLNFKFGSTGANTLFEPWPQTIDGLRALCRAERNVFESQAEAEAYAGWRYCVVDGGYVGLICNFVPTGPRDGQPVLEIDFGFYMDHGPRNSALYDQRVVKPLLANAMQPLPYNADNSRLLKAAFLDDCRSRDATQPNAYDWLREICVARFQGGRTGWYWVARPGARIGAYNALRHLSARDIRTGGIIPQDDAFIVKQRKIVAFILLNNLTAARRKYNLHDRSKYQPVDAQNPNLYVVRTEMSAADVVRRMHLAVIAARECLHPEIRGILTRTIADETIDDLNMQDSSAACLPPKLTFGFSRVRTGTQDVRNLRRDMLKKNQFEIFAAALTATEIDRQTGFRGNDDNANNRRMQYEMDILDITDEAQQDGLARYVFYTTELANRVNGPIDTDHRAPQDYIQRHTVAGIRRGIVGALHTWAGARAHEMTFVRIMCGADDAVFANVLNPRYRYSTGDAPNGPNVPPSPRVRTARQVYALCLPMEADQFGLQQGDPDAQGRPTCYYTFATNYLQDAFPIPERLPAIQAAQRVSLTDDYETRLENTLETLCHVFAANTHAAMRAFMDKRGYLIFKDVLKEMSPANIQTAHGNLEWDVVGAEYPIYNPHAMFTGKDASKLYPLFYETRADAVLHAHYPGSTTSTLKTGRVIMVEYKDIMERNNPAGRIMDYRSIYQCLCNAYVFFMNVGVLPTHALMIHSTRRAVYRDRDYTVNVQKRTHSAYVSLLRVDLSSRMQMRLFQRVLTNPLNYRMRENNVHGGETVYMDDRVYLFDANERPVNSRWYPCLGEPSEDMPAVMAQDDPYTPNFAVTRACVALHERTRRMWHDGAGTDVDSDPRVRPEVYDRQRVGSRFMAYDYVIQHMPGVRQNRPLYGNQNAAYAYDGNAMETPQVASGRIERSGTEQLWRKIGDWHNVVHRMGGSHPLHRVIKHRNQIQGFALGQLPDADPRIAEDRMRTLCTNIQEPEAPLAQMDRNGLLLRQQAAAVLTDRKFMAPAAIIFDVARPPMMAHYDRAVPPPNDARAPVRDQRLCRMPGRHYRDEPAINAAIRKRINSHMMLRAYEMSREFPNGDAQYHFQNILNMRDTADLNRAQFGDRAAELYNKLAWTPPLPEELDADMMRTLRTARVIVFYRAIQRLMNVRVFAATHALVGAPLGGGWFNEESHTDDVDGQIRTYRRSQVFPHVSDRGSWSTFALSLLAADVQQVRPSTEDASRGAPPSRALRVRPNQPRQVRPDDRPARPTPALQAIDIAYEDIRQHVRRYYEEYGPPPADEDGAPPGRGPGRGDEGDGDDDGDDDDGDGDEDPQSVANRYRALLQMQVDTPQDAVEFAEDDYGDLNEMGADADDDVVAYAPNVIVLVGKIINAILHPSPTGESATWGALVGAAEGILRVVAARAVQNFTEDVFQTWLRSVAESEQAIDDILRHPRGSEIRQHAEFNQFLEVYVPVDAFIDTYLSRYVGRKVFKIFGDGTCLLHAYAYSHILSSQARTNARAGFAGYRAANEVIEEHGALRDNLQDKMRELGMPEESIGFVAIRGAYLDECAIQALAVLSGRDVYLQAHTGEGAIHESLGLRGFPSQDVVPLDEPLGLTDRPGVWLPPFEGSRLNTIRVAMSQSVDDVNAPIVLTARAVLTGGTSSNHYDATTNVPESMTYQAALHVPHKPLRDIIQDFNRTPLRLLTKENALFVLEHDTRLTDYFQRNITDPDQILDNINRWLRGEDEPAGQNRLNEANLNKESYFRTARRNVITSRRESNRMRVSNYLQGADNIDKASWYTDDIIIMYYSLLQGRDLNNNFIFFDSQNVANNNSHFYNTEEDPARATNGPSVLTLHPDDCKNLDAYRGNVRSFILPHMLNNAHWFLVVLHLPETDDSHGRVLIYDPSPGGRLTRQQVKNLKNLMVHATKVLNLGLNRNVNTELINFWYVRGHPVQENDYDCGVYTCIYSNYVTRGYAAVDENTVDMRANTITVQLMENDPLHDLRQIYLPCIRKRIHYECLTCELSDELPAVNGNA